MEKVFALRVSAVDHCWSSMRVFLAGYSPNSRHGHLCLKRWLELSIWKGVAHVELMLSCIGIWWSSSTCISGARRAGLGSIGC